MPRGPEKLVPLRGPFSGLKRGAATRTPPLACYDCLNVLCADGSIRRRPGLETLVAGGGNGLYLLRALRMVPFVYPYPTPAAGFRTPYLAIAAETTTGGASSFNVFVLPLISGVSGYEPPLQPLSGEVLGTAHAAYRFALVPLNNYLLLRKRTGGAPSVQYKKGTSSSWTLGNWWIAAPLLQQTDVSVVAGTLVTGTYGWLMTYVNSNTGVESPVSPEVSATQTGPFGVTIAFPTGVYAPPAADQVDKVRIYRKMYTVDSEYYRIGEVSYSPGGSFTDNGITAIKTSDYAVEPLASLQPGAGCDAVVWQNRLWIDTAPDTLYYSDFDEYHAFRLQNSLRAGDAYGDEVRRLIPAEGILYVLKHQSIWQVQGSGPESYRCTRLVRGIGLASDHGVVEAKGVYYFCGHDGVYELSPTGLRCVSDDVAELYQAYRDPHWRTLGFDPERNLIICHGYLDEQYDQPQTLVYHIPSEQWTRWDVGGPVLAAGGFEYLGAPRAIVQVPADLDAVPPVDGCLALLRADANPEQRDFSTTAVPWYWDTGPFDFGSPYMKHAAVLHTEYVKDAAAVGASLRVDVAIDQEQSLQVLTFPDNGNGLHNLLLGRVCRYLRLKLSATSRHRPRITGLELEAEALGNL